jgi:hypothetical protein
MFFFLIYLNFILIVNILTERNRNISRHLETKEKIKKYPTQLNAELVSRLDAEN